MVDAHHMAGANGCALYLAPTQPQAQEEVARPHLMHITPDQRTTEDGRVALSHQMTTRLFNLFDDPTPKDKIILIYNRRLPRRQRPHVLAQLQAPDAIFMLH
jgi:hypothetical protein